MTLVASIRKDQRSGRYLVCFRFAGRQYQRALKTTNRKAALAQASRVDDTIQLVSRGRLEMPSNIDPAEFILSDGRLSQPRQANAPLNLTELFDLYFNSLPAGAKEEATIAGEKLHKRHILNHINGSRIVVSLTTSDLQLYMTKRLECTWNGKPITVDTIKKELTTFRLIWNWAERQGHLTGRCPTHGITYPKRDAKPPFMTSADIEQIIARGGLTKEQERQLWECLFLDAGEVESLLDDVREQAIQPFVYPMLLFAAHTGARRSEILRSQIDDLDFQLRLVLIREKKRSRTHATTFRRVPMTNRFYRDMREWIALHPGGQFTIAQAAGAVRGHARRENPTGLTVNEGTDHFKRTIHKTKWKGKLKGFHTLRHSFASNAAAAGVEQGMIDTWMGHQTEEMRNRYRHLFPKQQQSAIDRIFSDHHVA
ncbi:MAG: tyrosine-type recombinase/integrase [Planctomycetaceae bacterium]|nr:tyrosine-type recombinase/integrase [Planctomycetaceae bacterium]